ncbi:hypothetical protein ACFYXH_36175 [Streptomyces sp. NPDC002730]|uniref:hypothetical protein n=1 Tax=Streptomyces sp. NPDC002730 TaxID=3364662 RepID=UPI0036BAA2E6
MRSYRGKLFGHFGDRALSRERRELAGSSTTSTTSPSPSPGTSSTRHRCSTGACWAWRRDDSLDLADPYGLVRSRALASPDGGVRIILNIAPAPGAEDTRLQHIAPATDERNGPVRPAP